jgi:iron(III) transport system ATP-binding protein
VLRQERPIPLAASLACAAGETLALVGPSGSGKSTILRAIAGIYTPSTGRIDAGGETWLDTAAGVRRPARERSVGFVFQSYALFPHLSALDNVIQAMGHVPAADRRERALRLLERTNLGGLEDRRPARLSGGQQQRVAVARSLVLEPKVLLFDEPLSNLDAKLRRRVRQEIRELQQLLALTVLYVTHDQEEALAVSDHIIVMDGGKIAQQGTPRDLYESPASRFLADFIGDANLVDGELVVTPDGGSFVAGGAAAPVRPNGMAPGPATLAVRPHRLRLVDAGRGVIAGTCKRAAYLGSRNEYVIGGPWGDLLVFDDDANALRRRDDAVGLDFDPGAVILLKR